MFGASQTLKVDVLIQGGELLMCWRQMLENDDKVIKRLYCSQSVTYLTMTAAKDSRPISMARQHVLLVK